MTNQIVVRDANGLIAGPNPITAPEGSCTDFENCVVDSDGVISKVRGFHYYRSEATTSGARYAGHVVAHVGSDIKYDAGAGPTMTAITRLLNDNAPGFQSPDGYRLRFQEVDKVLYVPTSIGVVAIDDLTQRPRMAGMPEGLNVECASNGGAGNWLPNNHQVAYRVLWSRINAASRLITGAPSWRTVYLNSSGGAVAVDLSITIPKNYVLAGDYYEIYRTVHSTGDPGDECFLVVQGTVTSGQITAGTVTYTDLLSEAQLLQRLPLYTNASEETSTQENSTPPWCTDICTYRGYTFYLNTKQRQTSIFQLLTTSGITDDTDYIKFTFPDASTMTYTFSTARNVGAKKFKRYHAGDGKDERNTMLDFCYVINNDTSNTKIFAYYDSKENEDPGIVRIESRDFGQDAFHVQSTGIGTHDITAKFNPIMPDASSGSWIISDDDARTRRYYWSKYGQSEAVPKLNYDDVGGERVVGGALLRGIPLQASLLLLTENGVWRQIGEDDRSFDLRPLDPQIKMLGKDTIAQLDNCAYGLSNQGVIRANENGVSILSWPVERDLMEVLTYPDFLHVSHAVAYPTDRKYTLWTQEVPTDTYATIGWVFNHLTNKWAIRRKNCRSMWLSEDENLLYFAEAGTDFILRERRSGDLSDYKEEDIQVTVTAVGTTTDSKGNTVTTATITGYPGTVPAIDMGFSLEQSGTSSYGTIYSVTGTGPHSLVLDGYLPNLASGAGIIGIPVVSLIRWRPETAGNPAVEKEWQTFQILFENEDALRHQIAFVTDKYTSGTYYKAKLQPAGNSLPKMPILRVQIPSQYRLGAALSPIYKHQTARENFRILSWGLTFRQLGERTSQEPR